jgi:hypothetical protein
MGDAARDRASSRFSARVMAQNVESLYEDMLGRRSFTPAYAS